MTNIQELLEKELDNLLENIKGEWDEAISENEELFFQNLGFLHDYDDERANEYSSKYNEIIMGRDAI